MPVDSSTDQRRGEGAPRPIAICSWSGGKDSCLSYHQAIEEYEVTQLVHMAVREDAGTEFDAVDELLAAQARAIGVPLVRRRVTWDTYEPTYRETLDGLEPTHCVFGNIEGAEFREWVDDLCDDLQKTPVYPLWDEDPVDLFRSLIDEGFDARIVKIDTERVDRRWLGARFDEEFLDYLVENDLHPMGEFGEYQTLTVDGPIFDSPVPVSFTGSTARGETLIADLELSD